MPIEGTEWRGDDGDPDLGDDEVTYDDQGMDPGEPAEQGDRSDAGSSDAFDEKHKQDFLGLLYLGSLTETFTWLGHTFTIRTMTAREAIEVGLVHKKYVGTISEVKAYQAAVVAACCTTVDGQPIAVPLSSHDTALDARFQKVLDWYSIVLDEVYARYMELEARAREVANRMGKASGQAG